MKKMLEIALLKIKINLKDRASIIWMLIAPLAFVLVITLIFGGGNSENASAKYPIGIVNEDTGAYSLELIDKIKEDSAFEAKEYTYAAAKSDVEKGNIAIAVVIPKDYSNKLISNTLENIDILKLSENENTIALSSIIGNYISQQKFSIAAGKAASKTLINIGAIKEVEKKEIETTIEKSFNEKIKTPNINYKIETVVHKKAGLDSLSTAAIGILIMFIMFFVSNGASTIFEEKELGTWNRLTASPIRNTSIIGGYILGTFLLGWLQIALLILSSRYIFHVSWGSSALGLIILFSSFLIAIIGLGTALAAFVKTHSQLSALTSFIVMPTSLIAGCMWPREFMPDFMLKLSNFVPQTWILKGLTDLITRGSDISAVVVPSIILLVFATIFFLTAVNALKLKRV